ncbi:hypothetical protein BDV97DRAFT_400946 [Delphinella strobiligena]|nr:hypothetical protein BDV97DRAFT_400946 [Delphinella strobiligena]
MSRYTIEELVALRESPLVKKPDELPSIEQWLDQSAQHPAEASTAQANQRKSRAQNGTAAREENNSPMGNFSQSRPSLLQTRHTSRSSMAGSGMSKSDLSRVATNLVRTLQADGLLEDIVLGPPKTSFASSRNLSKLNTESGEKLAATSEDANEEDPPVSTRSRFFQDRNANKPATGLKSDREGWRTGAKPTGEDDERNGDKERHNGRRDRNQDSQDESGLRRNGYGHGQQRSDQRWSRDGERPVNKLGEGQRGGWRERERAKQENQHGRDGQPHNHNEREPEWMDEPAAKEDSMPQMKTVEDFEKWKESMKRKSAPTTADDIKGEIVSPPEVSATPVKPASTTPATPIVPDAGFGQIFGTWGQSRPLESPAVEPTPKQAKPAGNSKAKSSRFASMFAPKDEPRQFEEVAPASPCDFTQPPNGSAEDKEGFARIMAMLGKPTMSPGPGQSRDVSSPAQAGALAALFGGAPQQQQQQQNRPPSFPQAPYPQDSLPPLTDKKAPSARPESAFTPDSFMSPRPSQDKPAQFPRPRDSNPASNVASPDPSRLRSDTASQPHQQQFPFIGQPPQQRNTQQTPESFNVQQIVAGERAQKPKGALNKDSEFLLNLISQAKNNNRSAAQQNQQTSQYAQQQSQSQAQAQAQAHANRNEDSFQLFLDQPPQQVQRKSAQSTLETHAPKPQQPHRMPGELEEQLFKGGIPQIPHMDMATRNERGMNQPQPRGQQQRVPPGFFEDPAIMQHQAQRQQQQQQQQQMQGGRRQSQHQVQGQLPEHLSFSGPPPPGFGLGGPPQQEGGVLPQPPPGFNPNMRHPPGFAGIPGIFQPPQQTGNSQQQVRGVIDVNSLIQPGHLAQMHGHVPQVPRMLPQSIVPLPSLPQGLQGMPPPPGFMNMNMGPPPGPPPPGFFNGMPPPPGFPGMPMMSPPGLVGAGPPTMRGSMEGPMLRSPIEQSQGQGMPPGMYAGVMQQQQMQQQRR